jgi:hypothetical protein
MASWRYGLGKAVAFTSDASGRWAKNWLNWDGFSIFWSQAVRSTINDSLPSSVDIQVKNEGSHARIIVDAAGFTSSSASETAPYLNNYDIQANIISPDGSTQTITFSQVAPGRYEAVFLPSSEGIYLLRVTGTSSTPGDQGISEISGWSMEYSPEYRRLRSDPDALVRLAALSGGRIAETNPAQIFKHSLPVPDTYWPAWPVLLALAAMMLPVDIAVRRLVVTRNDIERSVQSLQAWLQSRLMRQPAVAEQHETMRSLFKAKRNAGEQWEKTSIQQRVDKPSTDSSLGELEKKDRKTAEGQVNEQEQISSQANEPASQSQGRKDARTPVDSSVSALLKSKRSRRNHNSSDE